MFLSLRALEKTQMGAAFGESGTAPKNLTRCHGFVGMSDRFSLPEGMQVSPLDTSIPGSPLLVRNRGKHYQIGGLARDVIRCLRPDGCTIEEIESQLCDQHGHACTPDQLQEVLKRLQEISLVQTGPTAIEGQEKYAPKQRGWELFTHQYFAFRVSLFSPSLLHPITRRLAPLFSPFWMLWLMPLLGLFQLVFCWFFPHPIAGAISLLKGRWELVLFLLANYVGLFLHELGHASACIRCGIKHGPIGAGIYLVFPTFYTDVSETWSLPRRSRTVVDAAGMYVSLTLATVAVVLYFATKEPLFGLIALIYDVTVLLNLNPFVRMDGYWLLSDALGIPNLMAGNREMTAWLAGRMLGRTVQRPKLLSIPGRLRNLYLGYYCCFAMFVVYAVGSFYGWYLPRLLASYPDLFREIWTSGRLSWLSWATAKAAFQLLLKSVPLIGLLIYGWRFLRQKIAAIRTAWSSAERSNQSA